MLQCTDKHWWPYCILMYHHHWTWIPDQDRYVMLLRRGTMGYHLKPTLCWFSSADSWGMVSVDLTSAPFPVLYHSYHSVKFDSWKLLIESQLNYVYLFVYGAWRIQEFPFKFFSFPIQVAWVHFWSSLHKIIYQKLNRSICIDLC